MKILGTPIGTPIARHAVTDDSCVSKKPWSSRNIVDKLCPSFVETGTAITCEPFEGSPLGVEVGRKNLIPQPYNKSTFTGNGITFTVNDDYSITIDGTATGIMTFLFLGTGIGTNAQALVDIGVLVGETYTMSLGAELPSGVTLNVFFYNASGEQSTGSINTSASSYTFTPSTDSKYVYVFLRIGTGDVVDNLTIYPMLERGGMATSYSPYNIVPTVNHIGKNLLGYEDFDGVTATNRTMSCVDGLLISTFTGSVSSSYIVVNASSYMKNKRLSPGTYVFSINQESTGKTFSGCYAELELDDGTTVTLSDGVATTIEDWATIKSLRCTVGSAIPGGTVIKSTVQIEVGNVATDYEPYKCETYEGSSHTITAYKGVNTLVSENGYITVTGKKDRVKALEDLTNAIIALGGNV